MTVSVSAVSSSSVIYRLKNRTVLSVEGEDRKKLLQGLLTQDVNAVSPDRLLYALMLNNKGRFLFDMFLREQDDTLYVETDADRAENLIDTFKRYRLRRDVRFTDCSGHMAVYASLPGKFEATGMSCFQDPRDPRLGYRCYADPGITTGIQTADISDYQDVRLLLGIAEGGMEIPVEKAIPLEWGMDRLNAVSWTKGCYIGQELTARTKHLGVVRKKPAALKSSGILPPPGTGLYKDGMEIGTVYITGSRTAMALVYHETCPETLDWNGNTLYFLPLEGSLP